MFQHLNPLLCVPLLLNYPHGRCRHETHHCGQDHRARCQSGHQHGQCRCGQHPCEHAKITSYGIEMDGDRFAHIATLLPQCTDNFVLGSLFDEEQWQRRYNLALLMPGRLLEVEPAQAEQLRQRLKQHCEQILIYAYGDWLTRYTNLAGLAEQAGLRSLDVAATAKCSLAIVR